MTNYPADWDWPTVDEYFTWGGGPLAALPAFLFPSLFAAGTGASLAAGTAGAAAATAGLAGAAGGGAALAGTTLGGAAAAGAGLGTAAGIGTATALGGLALSAYNAFKTPPKPPKVGQPPTPPTFLGGLNMGGNRSLAAQSPGLALGGTAGGAGSAPAPSSGQKTLLGQ